MADLGDNDSSKSKSKLHQNQPYDESLDVPDAEEVASTYSPTPRASNPLERERNPGSTLLDSRMTDQWEDDFDGKSPKGLGHHGRKPPVPISDDDDDGSDSSDEDDDEDNIPLEGAYDPADYENLSVSQEIKDLFQYITRYTPQTIELDHKLKPFIPDFIPAVGDIDAFLKVPRTDKKTDYLGLTVLDEPCARQSDPTVLDLQLRAISKQTTAKTMVVKSIAHAEKDPKQVDNWIQNIQELHRSKPPPNVHYTKNMPEIDPLMQEWPPEFEDLLKEVSLPSAEMDCDLGEYVDIISSILDIPVYKTSHHNDRIQALHVLFTLYTEFKNSQHFQALAQENKMDNALKQQNDNNESNTF